jgi:hypothetical protein
VRPPSSDRKTPLWRSEVFPRRAEVARAAQLHAEVAVVDRSEERAVARVVQRQRHALAKERDALDVP